MGQWVVAITGYDTSGPGLTTKVYAMGAGLAFTDAAMAPSGFTSWESCNQHVDVSQDGGVSLTADVGQLVLQNLPDDISLPGPLDALAEWSWQNRAALLYWISDGTWTNRQLVDIAVLQQPVATLPSPSNSDASLTFPLRDPRAGLAVPLQPTKYLGSNAGSMGVEGETDLTGKPKPILYGVVSNIPGVRVNASLLIYQVADVSATVLCVRDGGAGLAAGTVRGSLALLQSTSPLPGTYDIYAGTEGTFVRLGTTPVFQVGIDAQEGASGSSRTNLMLFSADLTQSAWIKSNATVTANAAVAPDGTLTADKLVEAATTSQHTVGQFPTVTSGQPYSGAIYVKAAERTFCRVIAYDGGSNFYGVNIDLTSGAATVTSGGALTGVSFQVRPAGNGWYRIIPTANAPGTSFGLLINTASALGTVSYLGDGASGIYVWGAQFENAAAATQYIATGAAAVTAPGMAGRTHAQIWDRFRLGRCGNVTGDINAASLTACDALDNNEVGFWWADEATCLDAMNEILTSLSGFEVQGFDLKWSINKLVAPTGTTVLDFVIATQTSQMTAKNRALVSIARARPGFAPDGAPPYQVIVNWGLNYQVFAEADFAGVAPQRLRDKFKLQYRSAVAINTAIWNPATSTGPWLNAPALTINSRYQPGCDGLTAAHATEEAARLETLYGANKAQYQISFVPRVTDQISVGAICSMTHPQMTLSGSPKFVVLQSKLSVKSEVSAMTLVLGFQT